MFIRGTYSCENRELFELSNAICFGDCSMKGVKILSVEGKKKLYKRVEKKVELMGVRE